MLHFLSPPPESGKDMPAPPRHRPVEALPRDARRWPFRVSGEGARVDLGDVAMGRDPGAEYAFVT